MKYLFNKTLSINDSNQSYIFIPGGRSDEEWSCSCSATSRTTHKKFSCEIGLKPGTDEKKGVDYFFKIDGMLFEDAQTLYCETREGVQALRTFANLNELPRENPAWTVLATPRKLKLQDKLLTVVQSQGTTKYSGRWKTLTNWSLPLKDETVNVYLEHAANGISYIHTFIALNEIVSHQHLFYKFQLELYDI